MTSGFLFPLTARAQIVNTIDNPIGNTAVKVEKLIWTKPTPSSPVTISFVVKNNTPKGEINTVQFMLVARNKNNVILQNDGATLRKLSGNTTILPGETGTVSFDKAFTVDQIDSIELKQVIVQFTNGSLEILKN